MFVSNETVLTTVTNVGIPLSVCTVSSQEIRQDILKLLSTCGSTTSKTSSPKCIKKHRSLSTAWDGTGALELDFSLTSSERYYFYVFKIVSMAGI